MRLLAFRHSNSPKTSCHNRSLTCFRLIFKTKTVQELVPLVDEFAGRLFGELDYEMEGRSCEKFQALYGGMPRVRLVLLGIDLDSELHGLQGWPQRRRLAAAGWDTCNGHCPRCWPLVTRFLSSTLVTASSHRNGHAYHK